MFRALHASVTAESIIIDRAEFARAGRHALQRARKLYDRAAASPYPLHSALGHLGLALIEAEEGGLSPHASTAALIARQAGCRLVSKRARELLDGPADKETLREMFFC